MKGKYQRRDFYLNSIGLFVDTSLLLHLILIASFAAINTNICQ